MLRGQIEQADYHLLEKHSSTELPWIYLLRVNYANERPDLRKLCYCTVSGDLGETNIMPSLNSFVHLRIILTLQS